MKLSIKALLVMMTTLITTNTSAQEINRNKAELIPTVELSNKVEMPLLGFGTLRLPKDSIAECVSQAIKMGFRLIDTAKNYANEEEVGRGIKMSGVDRKELFITSKLWIKDYGYEEAKQAFQATIDRLGVDYLDLYLLHQPFGDIHGAWRALEELYREGKIRAIGISNFFPDRMIDLCYTSTIRPMVNQVEFSPYYQQWKAKEWNDNYGVKMEAWGAMVCGTHPEIFTDSTLVSIGNKYKKSAAQVILRYLTQRGVVTLCCTGNPNHMQEDYAIFDFSLTEPEMHRIDLMDKGHTMAKNHQAAEDVEWFHEKSTRTLQIRNK